MKFDIYGRFQVEVRREGDAWSVYRAELGKRIPVEELVIPPDVTADELVIYLDDIFHELAQPGRDVVVMPD